MPRDQARGSPKRRRLHTYPLGPPLRAPGCVPRPDSSRPCAGGGIPPARIGTRYSRSPEPPGSPSASRCFGATRPPAVPRFLTACQCERAARPRAFGRRRTPAGHDREQRRDRRLTGTWRVMLPERPCDRPDNDVTRAPAAKRLVRAVRAAAFPGPSEFHCSRFSLQTVWRAWRGYANLHAHPVPQYRPSRSRPLRAAGTSSRESRRRSGRRCRDLSSRLRSWG